jgi:hypothetical protein
MDTASNKWTITTGGQVAVNGLADTTTKNVIELVYMNGTIWQENNAGAWWTETQPNASWVPAAPPPPMPIPTFFMQSPDGSSAGPAHLARQAARAACSGCGSCRAPVHPKAAPPGLSHPSPATTASSHQRRDWHRNGFQSPTPVPPARRASVPRFLSDRFHQDRSVQTRCRPVAGSRSQ